MGPGIEIAESAGHFIDLGRPWPGDVDNNRCVDLRSVGQSHPAHPAVHGHYVGDFPSIQELGTCGFGGVGEVVGAELGVVHVTGRFHPERAQYASGIGPEAVVGRQRWRTVFTGVKAREALGEFDAIQLVDGAAEGSQMRHHPG